MKNKLIKILLMLFMCLGVFSSNVMAAENDSGISYQRIDGAYFYLVNNSNGAVDTNHVTKFFLNGQIAYCIEPMVDINTRVYSSTGDWNVTGLSVDQRRYIEKVGYFGYEYPGHGNDRYWLAAQTLIWENVNPNVSVRFTTGPNGTGDTIDLSPEKNEIINLMNSYEVKASFHNTTIEGNVGDEFTIEDTNGVLNTFSMYYNGKHEITHNGNSLTIKLKEKVIGEEIVEFRKGNYDSGTTIIYYNGASQKLASLRISDPASTFFKLKSNGGNIIVNKTGEQLVLKDASYYYQKIKLEGAEFALYANEDITDNDGNVVYNKYQLVTTFTSDSDGIARVNDLYLGKYFWIEGESSNGNMKDEEKHYFEISTSTLKEGKIVAEFELDNFLPKGKLDFSKEDVTDGKGVPNTNIQVFTEDDRLVFSGTTDEEGKIKIDNLFTGKFYIIETKPETGYKLSDEKVYFEIKENGDIAKASMTNEKIKGTLDFTKLDISNDNPVPNTLIEIYDEKDNLIFSGRTDENGKIIIENLEYGKYYILEKEAPKGYKINPEKMWFEIKNDGEVVKAVMKDELEIIEVPNTKKNEKYEVVIGGIIILIFGIGVVLFASKKIK